MPRRGTRSTSRTRTQPSVPGAPTGRPAAVSTHAFSLPASYGTDRIVLMVKDPWWLFAYWEIQPQTERAARRQLLPHEVAGLQTILRVYDVSRLRSGAKPTHPAFDIPLSGLATNWYLPVNPPHHSWMVDIGILTTNGRFIMLARSNRVQTPRGGPSDVIDPAWAVTEAQFRKLAGGVEVAASGSSPLGPGRSVLPAPRVGGSSPALGDSARPTRARGFWCRVEMEVIVHGATEPRSTVQIQGQPVQVRADGTFSARLALPDGTQTVTVEAISPDGRHTQTARPIISRTTPPVGQPEAGHQGAEGVAPRQRSLSKGSTSNGSQRGGEVS